jgi:hypothetical protein
MTTNQSDAGGVRISYVVDVAEAIGPIDAFAQSLDRLNAKLVESVTRVTDLSAATGANVRNLAVLASESGRATAKSADQVARLAVEADEAAVAAQRMGNELRAAAESAAGANGTDAFAPLQSGVESAQESCKGLRAQLRNVKTDFRDIASAAQLVAPQYALPFQVASRSVGALRVFVTSLRPMLESVIDSIKTAGAGVMAMLGQARDTVVVSTGFADIAKSVREVASAARAGSLSLGDLVSVARAMGAALVTTFASITASVGAATVAIRTFAVSLAALAAKVAALAAPFVALGAVVGGVAAAFYLIGRAIGSAASSLVAWVLGVGRATAGSEKLLAALDDVRKQASAVQDALDRVVARRESLGSGGDIGGIVDQASKSVAELLRQFEALRAGAAISTRDIERLLNEATAQGISESLAKVRAELAQLERDTAKGAKTTDEYIRAQGGAGVALGNVATRAVFAARAQLGLADKYKLTADEQKRVAELAVQLADRMQQLEDAERRLAASQADLARAVALSSSEWFRLSGELETIDALVTSLGIGIETQAEKIERAQGLIADALSAAAAETERARREFERLQSQAADEAVAGALSAATEQARDDAEKNLVKLEAIVARLQERSDQIAARVREDRDAAESAARQEEDRLAALARKEVEAQESAADEVRAIRDRARMDELRAMGEETEAIIAEIKARAEAQIEAVRARNLVDIALERETIELIRRSADAQIAAIRRRAAENTEAYREQQRQQAELARELEAQDRVRALRAAQAAAEAAGNIREQVRLTAELAAAVNLVTDAKVKQAEMDQQAVQLARDRLAIVREEVADALRFGGGASGALRAIRGGQRAIAGSDDPLAIRQSLRDRLRGVGSESATREIARQINELLQAELSVLQQQRRSVRGRDRAEVDAQIRNVLAKQEVLIEELTRALAEIATATKAAAKGSPAAPKPSAQPGGITQPPATAPSPTPPPTAIDVTRDAAESVADRAAELVQSVDKVTASAIRFEAVSMMLADILERMAEAFTSALDVVTERLTTVVDRLNELIERVESAEYEAARLRIEGRGGGVAASYRGYGR